MAEKKVRERVSAEITLSHLMRLGNEQGCPVSREQALVFLNHNGQAFEMWKRMMEAAEDFIACSLLRNFLSSGGTMDSRVSLARCEQSMPRSSLFSCSRADVQELCKHTETHNRAS